jgi:hypothetical protein
MGDVAWLLAGLAADLLRERAALVAKNALLRQQLIVGSANSVGVAAPGVRHPPAKSRFSRA